MSDIDERIKELEIYRLKNKITQKELADFLGVAVCTVGRWFRGYNKPNKIQSYQIEMFLGNRIKLMENNK